MKLKICIDISQIIYGTGVSFYTKQLVQSLLQIDKNNQYILFGNSLRQFNNLNKFADSFSGRYSRKILPIPPMFSQFLWNDKHILPIDKIVGEIDVFHSSDWTQPPSKAFKVTTIHDLSPLRFPNLLNKKVVDVHKKRLMHVKKEVNKIIAVSEFTKNEIVDLLDVDPKKIKVIYEAPDPTLRQSSEEIIKNSLDKFKIIGKFLLVVGTDPRKNIKNILKAFMIIKKNIPEISLVITGNLPDKIAKIDGVKSIGFIKREDLIALYSSALALVYTSSYEGFGLPILEAMKLNCPVVTSSISSMPEISGNAAVLVNPFDEKDIANGIEKILCDRFLWISRGKKRVKKFSWIDTAEQTLKIYKEAL